MASDKYTPAEKIVLRLQAFRAGDAVAIGTNRAIGKRTIDLAIASMVDAGKVIRVAHGLYVNAAFAKANGDIALGLVANAYQDGMAISLGSSLLGVKGSHHGTIQAVVPSGRIGVLDTAIGTIEIHQISKRLMNTLVQEFGQDACFIPSPHEPLRVHTPEMAATLSAYLVMCGDRANFNASNLKANTRIDWNTVQEMTAIARIPDKFLEPVYESVAGPAKKAKPEPESSSAQPSI